MVSLALSMRLVAGLVSGVLVVDVVELAVAGVLDVSAAVAESLWLSAVLV